MPGRNIKKLREERQITQNEMAELLFMSQSNYSKIENNRVELTVELSKRIVKILSVTLEDILPDDAVLESPLLTQQKTFDEAIFLARVDELLTRRLDDFKVWVDTRLQNRIQDAV